MMSCLQNGRRFCGKIYPQVLWQESLSRQFALKVSAPAPDFFVDIGQREINLPLESVHARDKDAKLIADRQTSSESPTDQTPLGRLEYIKVVRQRRNVDKARDKNIRQFNHNPVIADIDNRCAKDLRIALV